MICLFLFFVLIFFFLGWLVLCMLMVLVGDFFVFDGLKVVDMSEDWKDVVVCWGLLLVFNLLFN